jgi:protein involved in polysaccharide export with SLBB domain
MRGYLKYYYIVCLIFSITITNTFSQVDLERLKKLQERYQKSKPSESSRLLSGIIEEEQQATKSTQDDSLAYDSITVEVPQEEKEVSLYKNLIDDSIINPDSILKNIDIFGHSVFLKEETPFTEIDEQISVPADYHISPGDEVNVLIWGRINEEFHLTVDRNGRINIPRIGPVSVAGLPFNTMKNNIIKRIENIEGVQATISMGTLNNIRIFIVGEVNYPGQYTLSALTNAINAIFAAKGFSKHGSMRNVTLKRNGRTIKKFDFYEFLLSGNNFGRTRLKSGDVIFVPIIKKMAAIAGNVRRSALYELKGKTTLKDLINLAGGLTPAAWVNRIQIERFVENEQQVVFDLHASSSADLPDFTIEDGDIVKIFPVVDLDKNAVYLSGNVLRPGKYELHENMRVTDLINDYEQLLPETYFDYAIIRRKEPPSFAERIISFNLGNILEDNSSEENHFLKPLDDIIIYNKEHFQPDRTVSIDGAVTYPDTYKLLENMTIKDLILEAGGLREDASIERGELYKRELSHDSVHTVKIDFIISEAMNNNPSHNHTLTKLDYLYIRRKKGWEEKQIITLIGEFNFPGEYIILENETLGDLITRAGGFKPEAYLAAAILTRQAVKELEKKRTEEYISQLEMDIVTMTTEMTSRGTPNAEVMTLLDQQKKLLEKLKRVEPIGRVVIDFEKPENYQNLQLEDGDFLYVPKNHNTVSVLGEVFNPSTFVLEKDNASVYHYTQLAGGYKETANEKDVYVVKANGTVRTKKMVRLSRYNLESGDAVVIPIKLPSTDRRFQMILATTKDLLAITASTLLIAVTIGSLRN